ncbi:AMP-binding protein [Pseudonocardia pini]|uniref:AMP-binding protein n=1 Tax=Pseudonocardia pini TaxID=2758030 RepID=UPI0015F01F91|nr:AMP-binding protein [Pseudonocardia pini]
MHLSEIAARTPDKPAIVTTGGRTVTYAELDRRSLQVAALVRAHGLGPKDHVAVLMDNSPEFLEVAWGAQRAGQYWTPVNWHLTEEEAAYVVRDCGARLLFASPRVADLASRIAAATPGVEAVFVAGSSLDEALAPLPAEPAADEVEGTYFFYSSGTTGAPKGIRPDHAFPPFGTGLRIDHTMASTFGFGPDSVYLCPAPLYHAAPAGWSLGTLRNGGTVVLMERFDAMDCLCAIEQHRVSHVQFVPTHFVRMLKLPEEQRAAVDVSSLRVVVHAAAPCPVDVKHRMIEWFGPVLMEFYAGSEGSGMTVITSPDWLAHPGSVGRAAVGEVHIVDEVGEELPTGEIGAVYFSGGGSFEYHNDPDKTARVHDHRGWSTLGDMGRLDAEGYLYLADRRTDLIISGGVNVYPAEIEDAMIMNPAVADVAVVGVPDAEMGHSVRAVVQCAPGIVGTPELAEELRADARTRLAGFKVPRSVVFVDELPRLPNGKLLRRRVREEQGVAQTP